MRGKNQVGALVEQFDTEEPKDLSGEMVGIQCSHEDYLRWQHLAQRLAGDPAKVGGVMSIALNLLEGCQDRLIAASSAKARQPVVKRA